MPTDMSVATDQPTDGQTESKGSFSSNNFGKKHVQKNSL